MSALAAFLIAVALADLTRTLGVHRALPYALAVAVVVGIGLLSGQDTLAAWLLLVLSIVGAIGWLVLTTTAGRHEILALAVLGGTAVILFAAGGWMNAADGLLGDWMRSSPFPALTHSTPDRFLLASGVLLAQLATGNTVVRLVLAAIGAIKPGPAPQASDELRGGRLLGPMERLFIIGLGMAGQVTAASLVIAAKGLIRFPELQAKRNERESVNGVGIDEVTEYFLVGSFVSWLVALGGLATYSLL